MPKITWSYVMVIVSLINGGGNKFEGKSNRIRHSSHGTAYIRADSPDEFFQMYFFFFLIKKCEIKSKLAQLYIIFPNIII